VLDVRSRKALMSVVLVVTLIILAITLNIVKIPPVGEGVPVTTTTPKQLVEVKSFSSYEELVNFVKSKESSPYIFTADIGIPAIVFGVIGEYAESRALALVTPTATPRPASIAKGEVSYSKTNVQVAGVDEADIVKTDGKYIYVAPVGHAKVYIVKAYPGEDSEVVSEIDLHRMVYGLYVYGDKLVIIASSYRGLLAIPEASKGMVPPPYRKVSNTTILIYDISDRCEPKLIKDINITGHYMTSRMIGKYLYLITTMPVIYVENEVVLPVINDVKVDPTDIKYFEKDYGYVFTIILAVDVDSGDYSWQVFMLGNSANVYVSLSNLYILSRSWVSPEVIYDELEKVLLQLVPEDIKEDIIKIKSLDISDRLKRKLVMEVISDWFNSLDFKEREKFMKEFINKTAYIYEEYYHEKTVIYKFSLNGLDIVAVAKGSVPGYVLDQFSMDEYNGYFRVATTVHKYSVKEGGVVEFKTLNNVYVLDENLEIVGELEGLAPGERIYAARYLGDLMYLVTYRRVDPLFGIDLSDPKNPKVLGYLKIPGYSEYLHPINFGKNKYLIGIGYDTYEDSGIVRGIKVSLFNITDPTNITEVAKIAKEGAVWSPLFRDHKAFMINYEKGYFTFPVRLGSGEGVMVIKVGDGKLVLKGFVEHRFVERTIYIGEYLYLIGEESIKIVTEDLNYVKTIAFKL